ncbi:MAG: type II secretion system F family protein, partial [Candidatus Angelobacter sp.]
MAEFLIKMADERGHVLEQAENGVSAQEIRDRFVQQGYYVYSVRGRAGLLPVAALRRRKRRIKTEEFVIFNQQFLTLIKAGLPILKSLELLAKRQKNAYFKSMLQNVQERVKSGELLSDAFAAQGAGISKIYTTTVLAGERSGNLEEVLARYIAFQRVTLTFRKKLLSSLWYPGLLICALTIMLTFLMTYVVPQFADLYLSLDAKLPHITLVMLGIGTAIQHYYWAIIAGVVIIGLSFYLWIRSSSGARTVDAFRYRIPALGTIWMKYQVAMFSRTLSTLLSGGLPLVPSLETASHSINSFKISENVEH